MAIRAPFVVHRGSRSRSSRCKPDTVETAAAIVVFTGCTRANTTRATAVIAAAADTFTFAADRVTALLARVAVILVHASAAIRAAAAVPQRELHKRAFRVVGPQDAGDERKKIQ